ncbi:LOW QUALITY PROTEIN: uncharacterized protein col6a3 [Micropterus salmoides]|uniref:LOW QUALITY PROTEIN: uncharacterized protein col6a3 n=1 Tax=Micropterus salmoides TaxID=27706 RepID=UPI0018EA3ACC|nr:LOW QUALITY PROTEIN: uncharacterized protein col6a3 [Micropterus salmoides]
MRDFVQRVVETLSVDDNKDRVSVVQYSRDPAVQFYLNTYPTKGEILDSVRGLRHKGGRPLNTGAALQYLRDNVFTASAGSRRVEGVPQVLILLSGGKSSDSVDVPASALKQLGVLTITIGTGSSDSLELQKISHDPSYALSVSEFTDLPSVQQQLKSSVEAVVIGVAPESPTVFVDTAKKDIVFLLDGSDATRNGFPAMRDFVERVVEKLNVGENKDRVSVVQYSRDAEVHFDLKRYKTRDDILDSVRGLRHRGGRPLNTGAALQYVRDNVFTNSSGSRRLQGVPQMLILLNGGRSFDNVDTPASALKQQGIYVVGIGTRNSDSRELQKISYEPTYALSVSEFTDLPDIQEQLSSVMSTVLGRATPMTPTVTVERQLPGRDLVFLLDGSDGTRTGFPAMRDFVQRVVETLSVDDNKDRVSVVQYSRDPAVQFYLNTYTTKGEILDTVRGLRHKGGRPLNTGAALQYLRDNVFTASAGSRRVEGVPQVLILLSGGRSFDSVDVPASALKQLGVLTIAIGTRASDSSELLKISHDPSYALSVSEFTDLPSVQQQLKSSVEAVVIGVAPESPTVFVDTAKKDIVFLLDGSDATRNGFPAMRDFVERVVEKLNVGENKDRVSVVQYSRDAEVHFDLKRYKTRDDILDSVRGLRHRGGRPLNTGAALQYVRDNVFTNSSGSRRLQGVPQMLILLNGGRSFDNVDTPASALKQQGIYVVGIGTRNSDSRELQKISYEPTYALSVSEFTDLPDIQEQLSSVMSTVLGRATPMTPTVTVERQLPGRDLVFLLDGSDGTRTGFPAMRDFVQRVVETLSVDDNKDRVSVVQYSRDPAVQFYLNTYTTKGEILDTVRGLRHKGGRPLNTGAALQYLRDNVFTASAGSRRVEGVPQVLILLSGGRSFDSVDVPASALKQLGVLTIAIGTRASDSSELLKISHDPSYALSVSEFTDLPNIQQQLSSVMSTVQRRATPLTPTVTVERQLPGRDLVFLLDGSDGTRTGFPAMRDFVQRVVETLSVDDNKDRVSVVQYSREPAVQFYLNTYPTKGEILDSVRGLRHKGGRPLNTGAALQYLRDNVFTASAGSRRVEGVPQVLILLSGGKSSDSVDVPASALKQLGVLTITIGTGSSDSIELQKISHDPSYALSVSEFTDLPSVQQQLKSSVEAVVIGVAPESPTVFVDTAKKDIVFLLDGSDATRNGFPAMRDFVERVVEKLNVGENKDRVSVVQYSRDAEVHFDLKRYKTRDDILDSVRGLRHRGGRPLNTGAALQYVRDNVFTNSSGSRRLQGVPQMLILLNGGRSFDNVDTPASALKQQGIYVVGIGTRNSDSRELQKISYEPTYALSVSEFTDLPDIQEQLSSVMSTVLGRATPMTPTVTVERQLPGRDLVFLLDGSDGTRTGFPAMRDFVQRVVETLSVDDNKDRVSVVQYSRDPAVQFYLNTYTTKGEILDTVRGLRHKGGRPLNTGAALQYLRDNVFTASAGSRRVEGVPQVLILLSGGRSFDSVDVPASALKQLGVLTIAIGTRASDSSELLKISHDPSYALSVSEFTDLPNIQQQLSSVMSTVQRRATPLTPTVTVERQLPGRDLVFLLDGSDGTRTGFPAMRDFVQRVVETLSVDDNKDRVSVVQYSREPAVQFYLNTYPTKGEILDSVRGLRHKGGRPLNTGAALQYLRDNVFTASAGSRRVEGVPQVLILLSGGKSSDSVDVPASALKQLGVLTITIGTGSSDSIELQKISHDPSYALSVSEFTDLPSVQQQLKSSVEAVVIGVAPESPTVFVDTAKKDIVFLLDGSDATRNGFPAMRDFVERVVEKLNVGENKDRVSVVQYSRDAEVHFDLKRYKTRDDILDSVRGLRHRGGRPLNTGAALQYVRDNVFTNSSGSRRLQGVPQMLILLNGGRSFDNVDTPASALKQQGIYVVGIGTRNSDSRELQKISYEPTYALSVSEFTDLPDIQEQLSSVMSTVLGRATPMTPTVTVERQLPGRDLVFLLDGSDGTRTGFPAMRDFVQRVVETLSVDDNKDRVSVVQYSRDPAVQFYLNTYTTKGEILDTVRGLRHKGGRPLNTGAALQYLRDNVFTASAGSRRVEGVPQVLILLSGGRSFDSVDVPASALKQLGVLTIAIGTRASDSSELLKISHDPSYALSVSEFTDLPNIQQQLSSVMSTVQRRATPLTPTVTVERQLPGRDLVFLLDGSDGTRTGFPAMRDFVQRVVETLSVDDNKDRVSVVQYSREPAVQFYLNTYPTKGEILDSVRGLRHKGGRPLNTGAALQYLRDNVFTASAGSRRVEGVPQVLILLSGGKSSDSVDVPASALKQLGVLTITIGTGSSDSIELQKISHDPSYALSVSEFTDLPSVQQQLKSSVEAVVIGVAPESPTVFVDTAKKDIVFLLDGSDATRNGFPAMRDFVERVVEKLNVGENKDRVSVVQYSRDAEVHFDLKRYKTRDDILDSVRGLRHRGGRPLNTGAALQYVRDNVFTNSSGSRRLQGVPQMLILLNGGRSFDNVDTPASALKQQGIYVVGIGTRNSDSRELQKISYEPTYALSVSEFTDLPDIQEQLSSVMSTVLGRATPMTPTVTVERQLPGRDLVFLLDGSDGTRTGFPAMRDFVQRVVETLSVDDNKDRVSVVQYSRDPAVQFYLNTYTTKGEILDTVRGLRHKGGRPLNTGAALQYLRDNVFTASAGSRRVEGVPQVLILLSGGRSFDSVDVPASALKQLGVLTIAIGTRASDSSELLKISHDPSYALSVSEFTDLPNIQQQLSSVMSTVQRRATPLTPTVTVERQLPGRDLVFLLDGSDGTRTGFPAMRDFVQRVVETLSVDDNKDRVSVVQYSREPAVQFYLNTYPTKGEILDSVRGLRHKGGRPLNTGAALQYLRDNVFTASAGSRRVEGVPQVLILLSGGKSSDSVDVPASALKQLGVLTITIGTGSSDSIELQKISHDPSYALSVSEFTDLPSVQQQLKSSVEAVVIGVAPESPTVFVDTAKKDIVFLLDGSDATRNGFPAMRDFVERVVEKLNVGENKDRVSVVQYSRDAEVHFDLKRYKTRDDILDSVRGLRHRGGRPLNTGAALQYVRDNVFTNSSGSRRLQGVPQMLILLNGGRSFDNVDTPASALKQQGIYVVGIGTRNSDSRELQKISYEPTYALSVSEFTDLPDIQEQLSSVMSTVLGRATPMTPTVTVERQLPGRDLVFLLDGSDGTRTGFPAMRDFVQRVVETLSVDDNKDRVSVVQYSRDPAVQFYLNTYTTKGEILDTVRGLRHKGGRPLNTGAALQYLRDNVFTASAGSRRVEGVPQVLILLSGGRSFDSVDVPASALKQLGVLTIAIGTRASDSSELLKISHDPSYALSVSEFTDLPNIQQQLSSVMSTVQRRATPLTPTVTVERQLPGRDLVFLLDGSDGTRTGFPAMRDFVQRVVETLSVDDNKDRVSVVQYSREPAVQFYLNTYPTKGEILDSVRGLRHKGGRPLNTGAALQYLRDNVFTASAGSRRVEGVPQVLILLSGGKSSDSVDVPASALKQLGVLTITIGTGSSDSIELQKISHDPSYALSVSEFTDLPSVQQQLKSSVEAVVIGVAPESPTVFVDTAKKDIVFLLDGSDATRNGFPAMRDFVERVVEKLNVGENKDRVSVVQYSRDAEVHFDLKRYKTRDDILDSVRGLRHRGGRPLNTGAALQYVRDNVFTNSSGSRRLQGVPQMLILLNGGRSFDNVDTPASALKQQGIYVVGIGTRNSDSRELQKISYEPTYALSVSEFTDLPDIQEQLSSVMSTVLGRATPMTPTVTVERQLPGRDLVFLLDGSDGTRTGFPAMRDFVQRVVETLSVDDNKDRVSVVQYSRDPAVQFYLNTYTTKGEILDTVRGLRHKGGRPLNTGAALQYLRDNVFTASAGSRRVEGVPQVLILLSGGRSFDSVDVPASALKQLGVLTIAIGTRASDSSELLKISHDPSYALSVSEFTDLPNIQQQLSSVMSTVQRRATPLTPTVTVERQLPGRDLVFLLDGSDGTRTGFPAMRDFVQRVVETLSVDDNKDRVSVVQYSREPAVQFYLNTYPTKGEILDSVRGLRHKGGRPLNTGAALQYLRDNVFTASAGSRRVEGVPQVLILLSGGKSSDSVDVPASALKQLGVLTITIGTGSSDSIELQKISHDPSYALSVSEFTDLPSVQQQLKSSVEAVVIGVAPESPTVFVDTAKKDIVFLLDGSDATRNGFPAMRDFVERVVEKLNVGENKDRVSVVQYSRDAEVHFDLKRYKTRDDILDSVRGLRHRGGRPLNTGAALQYVRDNVFTNSSGSRRLQGVPQMLILLNGGRSFDNVDTPASALKQQGIYVVGIGTRNSDSRELQKISYEPTYALSVSEFTDLPDIQEQLSSVMSTVLGRATPMTPTVTVERQLPGRDLVFLLDGSDGTRTGFPAMRDFVQRVVETLSVDDNKDRVSVVQYSRDPAVQFYLNTYTKGEILDTVRGLRHKGGRPLNTGAALQYLRDNVFTASAGSRRVEGVPQVLILLSGGKSSDSVDVPASALKQLGVLTITIGTGSSDSIELQKISHDPSYALSVSEFTDLPSVQQQLKSSVEAVVIGVAPESPTVFVDTAKKDIVFLLDGSDATRNGFPAMRDFVERVVEKLNVGENKDRVSVVQYSRDAEVHFDLKRYKTRDDILDSVRGLRHRGGRPLNTGAALQYVRDNVFTNSSGSRRLQGVPQMLILLNGGRSFDNVDTPASALKQQGIYVVGIGTRNSDSRELQKISYEPTYALSVSEFTDLPDIQEQLSSVMSTVLGRATPMTPTVTVERQLPGRDLVFLLDGSDGTRTGFPAMRDFVQRVVETLSVDDNKDRVSVVQYSRDPTVQFYLNTYTTKGEILDTVRGLRHKGGRPLNTGAALQYLRDNVFTASAGSRRVEGVPQVLILLSGGRSFDSVDVPASALKQLGVLTIAIGTRASDSSELLKISHDPSYALSVSEFTDLPNIQQQLSSVMSTVQRRATPLTPTVTVERQLPGRDLVFLLDGSDGTRTGFPAMRDFVQRVVETLSVDDNKDRVSVVQYSREPAVQFYLNTYPTKGEILDSVRGLRHKGGRPLNTGAALQYLRDNVFTASAGSRRVEGVPQVLILLSGGKSSDSVDVPASALKQLGVLTITIGTGSSDSIELQKISHDPSYALSVSEFTDLPSVQQQLKSSVEAVVIGVAPESPTVFVDTAKKDIVFLLDGSDATRNGFPAMRDFVERVVEKLNVGENKDRVSVVQYSRDAEVHFDLKRYKTRDDILDSVRGLRHRGGRPLNTGAALQYVRDNVFTNSSGSRRLQGVPQMLILLNGGRSFDNVDTPASALKQQGIYVVGIGTRNSDSRELQKISYEPTYALSVSEFTDLPDIQEQLSSVMSTVLGRATPMTPTVTVERQLPGRDLVFLLDGSDGTRTGFPAMRDFVQRVVETLSVDDNKDRVSVVQYSRDPTVQFYLNTYTTKGEILDTVRGLRHKGGRPLNTGAALQYLRDNVFTASAGSRRVEGVPQVLILLSGGRSFDSVDVPASALKQLGVLTIAIGTRASDSSELLKISHDPSYALSVSEFTDLPNIQQQLSSVMSTVQRRATPLTPTVTVERQLPGRDLVFLLDGSDGTRTGFPAMRDFVQRVVETLSVDDNKDRVSVVQYSREPAVQFYLNTYPTKGEILDTVRGLRHKGGRPLNTGAALQYLRDNVFTASAGSRRVEGVPQVLILLSGGKSSDSVDVPASALKQLGVLTIAIGTRASDSSELLKISHDPSYALSVSEFTDLPNIQQQLSSVMSTVQRRATPLTPTVTVERQLPGRDLVFLLDGSDGTRTGFPAMRDFVQRVVETLSVDDNKDRVSVVQYSREPAVQFYLNTYPTKGEILDSVRGLRHKGGRPLNTGAALQYLRDNVFTASAGSRRVEGVPQVLILLSGGKSSDSVDVPASALKQLGVLTITIGTGSSDSIELQKISHDPSYALSVSEFTDLPSVQQQLKSSVEAVVIGVPQNHQLYLLTLPKRISYSFWMVLMPQGMASLPCVILLREWWRNSMWEKTKTVSLWSSTAEMQRSISI